jgi:Lysozyme inhibitor LprI
MPWTQIGYANLPTVKRTVASCLVQTTKVRQPQRKITMSDNNVPNNGNAGVFDRRDVLRWQQMASILPTPTEISGDHVETTLRNAQADLDEQELMLTAALGRLRERELARNQARARLEDAQRAWNNYQDGK